jgi:hypothetical protein
MKVMGQSYNLVESIFILTHSNKLSRLKGTWSGYQKAYYFAACFLELYLQEKIVFGKKLEVKLVRTERTNLPYLDEIIDIVSSQKKPKKLKSWLRYFHYRFWKKNKVVDLLAKDMKAKKLITDKSSWWKQDYEISDQLELSIIEMIRAELLETGDVRSDVVYLVFLLEVGKVLRDIFSTYEKGDISTRVKELKKRYPEKWEQVWTIKKLMDDDAAATTVAAT